MKKWKSILVCLILMAGISTCVWGVNVAYRTIKSFGFDDNDPILFVSEEDGSRILHLYDYEIPIGW